MAGVGFNPGLWMDSADVHFTWRNFTGLAVAAGVTVAASRPRPGQKAERRSYTLLGSGILAEQRR